MPCRPRMYIPGFPYHIVQRGNNCKACFLVQENFAFYLGLGKEISARYGVSVHAYCELFHDQIDTEDLHFIRKAAHYCQPVSDEQFREELSVRYRLEIGQMFRRRPRKHAELYKK